MKHVQSTFKETRFDWDIEPALERRSRLDGEFVERHRFPVRRHERRLRGLLIVISLAVGVGVIALGFLGRLLHSLV